MSKVTIKMVAAQAGVSTATVSRALSGSGQVSPKLRRAVVKAAESLGYSGNTVASSLRSSRTNTVGIVIPEIANPFMTHLVGEVEEALHARGMQLLLCNSRQDAAAEKEALTSLIARRVDGLIVCPVDAETSLAAVESAAHAVPTVQIDQRIDGLDVDWVGVDDEAAMRLIVDHLTALSVTSAAFIGSRPNDSSAKTRLGAFLAQAEQARITVVREHIFLDKYSVECGRQNMDRLARGDLPDAVVCAADIIAVGALQTCHARGIEVPSDVIITGFDDIEFASLCTPPLTTVRQPLRAIARHVIDILREPGGDGHGSATVRLALAPALVVRESSSHPPA